MNLNDTQGFEKLIDPTKYQVFLFSCPAYIPFSFAIHPWFVVNKKGIISRWEVYSKKNLNKTSWGHLHLNGFITSPFQGIHMFPFLKKYFWNPTLMATIEGNAAQKIIESIETSPQKYPFCNTYSLLGPNSNTYIQWILNQSPECNITLPWNAIGKNYV